MATAVSGPFQLRIVAPAAAAVTLTDQWQRLDRPSSGGPPGFYFCPATSLADGRIFHAWGATRLFTPVSGLWVDQNVSVGLRENCACAHDPVLNRVWITTGNPPGTGSAPPGEIYYSVASPSYTVVSHASSSTHDQAMEWHNGKLYRFGGFMGYDHQRIRSKNTNPETPWVQENDADSMPELTRYTGDQRQALLTYLRGGIDRRTGQAWWLGANNEVWLRAENGRWNVFPTFGAKPPQFSLAALNEDRNYIVTWCGKNQIASGDPAGGGIGGGPDLGVTYVLNLGTLVWRQSRAAHTIPLAVMASHILLYNRGRKKINLLAGDGTTTQVWEFTESA